MDIQFSQGTSAIPFPMAAELISRYILERKGVLISVIIPTPDDVKNTELFLKAANIAMAYYDI